MEHGTGSDWTMFSVKANLGHGGFRIVTCRFAVPCGPCLSVGPWHRHRHPFEKSVATALMECHMVWTSRVCMRVSPEHGFQLLLLPDCRGETGMGHLTLTYSVIPFALILVSAESSNQVCRQLVQPRRPSSNPSRFFGYL
jgi:hypothetical protein